MAEQQARDPEDVLNEASACLENISENDPRDTDWCALCNELSRVGRATWYRCACGEISPQTGSVDAVCPRCGEIRRLPPRLSRAPWPVYVRCLMRVFPDWFERLVRWFEAENLGHAAQRAAYARRAHSGEGDGAYGRSAEHSAGGDVPPEKYIACMDGMRISETGDVCGTAWIALPMPNVEVLKKIQ